MRHDSTNQTCSWLGNITPEQAQIDKDVIRKNSSIIDYDYRFEYQVMMRNKPAYK